MKKVESADRSQEVPIRVRPRILENEATRPIVVSGTLSL